MVRLAKGSRMSICSTPAANTPQATAHMPYCREKPTVAIITATVRGKPVSCADR